MNNPVRCARSTPPASHDFNPVLIGPWQAWDCLPSFGMDIDALRRAPTPGFLDGQMLIAMPGMPDERFARTVIYLCAHSSEGAMGIVVNRRARNIGFIFQFYNLMPVLDARENVELPLLLTALSGRERRQRAEFALAMVGLADRMDHKPAELSGGQQQRVAIARALVTDPTLIVADEPTGDLDRESAEAVLKLLQRLNREVGKTIVMVTHDQRAAEAAHAIMHLEKGELRGKLSGPLPETMSACEAGRDR